MKRFLERIWKSGVVGTFLTGLFFILPVVLTVAIIGWFYFFGGRSSLASAAST